MNEEMLFQQLVFIRNRTIAALDATPEEIVNEIPKGLSNNLLWNFGHIFVTQDHLLYSFLKISNNIPPNYQELFIMGSTPLNWNHDAPSLLDIRKHLIEQPDRIMNTFSGRLNDKGDKPFTLGPTVKFTTLGEVIGFSNFHEGCHQGTINTIKRILGVEDLWKIVGK